MKSKFSIFNFQLSTPKGFTLIELLIVIAVLGVLAAGVLVAVDPIERINSGNDARAQSDIGTIGRAAEAFATSHNGFYPSSVVALTVQGDLRAVPQPPVGYVYSFSVLPGGCSNGVDCTNFTVFSTLRARKWGVGTVFKYSSSDGKACTVAVVGNQCP